MVRRAACLLLCAISLLGEQPLANRYIIEFSKTDTKTLARHQKKVRQEIEKGGGKVLSTTEKLLVTFLVEMDAKAAEKIKGMPGVLRVVADKSVQARPSAK